MELKDEGFKTDSNSSNIQNIKDKECNKILDRLNLLSNSYVFVLDDKGVRNGKAQSVVWDEFDGEPDHNVVWDAMYKDGKLHGVCKAYSIKRVRKLAGKTFYVNGRAVDAKTVAEWRKVQSAMNAKAKSKQIKGR